MLSIYQCTNSYKAKVNFWFLACFKPFFHQMTYDHPWKIKIYKLQIFLNFINNLEIILVIFRYINPEMFYIYNVYLHTHTHTHTHTHRKILEGNNKNIHSAHSVLWMVILWRYSTIFHSFQTFTISKYLHYKQKGFFSPKEIQSN